MNKKNNTPTALSIFSFLSQKPTPKYPLFWDHNPTHALILFSSEVVFPLKSDIAFGMLRQKN